LSGAPPRNLKSDPFPAQPQALTRLGLFIVVAEIRSDGGIAKPGTAAELSFA
jgi:hypothetical protein